MAGLPSSILRLFPPLVALLEEPDLRRLVISAGATAWLETTHTARPSGVRVEAEELEAAVLVLAEKAGKVFDEAHPWFEAVLRDGSRFVGVRPPVSNRLTLIVERPPRILTAEVPATAAEPFAALRGLNVVFTGLGDAPLAGLGRLLGGTRVVEVSRPPASLPSAIHLVPQPGTDGPGLGDCLRLAGRMAAERALIPGLRTVQAWDLVATAATRPVPIALSLAAHDAGGALARLEAMARQGAGPRGDAVPGLIRAAFDRVVTIGPTEHGGLPTVREIAALVGDGARMRLQVLWSPASQPVPSTGVTRLVVRRAVRLGERGTPGDSAASSFGSPASAGASGEVAAVEGAAVEGAAVEGAAVEVAAVEVAAVEGAAVEFAPGASGLERVTPQAASLPDAQPDAQPEEELEPTRIARVAYEAPWAPHSEPVEEVDPPLEVEPLVDGHTDGSERPPEPDPGLAEAREVPGERLAAVPTEDHAGRDAPAPDEADEGADLEAAAASAGAESPSPAAGSGFGALDPETADRVEAAAAPGSADAEASVAFPDPEHPGAAALEPVPPMAGSGAEAASVDEGPSDAPAPWHGVLATVPTEAVVTDPAAPEAGDLDPRTAGVGLDFREAVDAAWLGWRTPSAPMARDFPPDTSPASDEATREIAWTELLATAGQEAAPGATEGEEGPPASAPAPEAAGSPPASGGAAPAPVVARPVGRPGSGAVAAGAAPRPTWDRRLTPRPVAATRPPAPGSVSVGRVVGGSVGGSVEGASGPPSGWDAAQNFGSGVAPAPEEAEPSSPRGAGSVHWGLAPEPGDEPGTVEVDLGSDSGLRQMGTAGADGLEGPGTRPERPADPSEAHLDANLTPGSAPEGPPASFEPEAGRAASAPPPSFGGPMEDTALALVVAPADVPTPGEALDPSPIAPAEWGIADSAGAAEVSRSESAAETFAPTSPSGVPVTRGWRPHEGPGPESTATVALPAIGAVDAQPATGWGRASPLDVGGTSEVPALLEASVSPADLSSDGPDLGAGLAGDSVGGQEAAAEVFEPGVSAAGVSAAGVSAAGVSEPEVPDHGDFSADREVPAAAPEPGVASALAAPAEALDLDAPSDPAEQPIVALGNPVLDGPLEALLRSLGGDDASSLDDDDDDESTTMITELTSALGAAAPARAADSAFSGAAPGPSGLGTGAERRSFSQILRSISGVHPDRLTADEPVPGRGRHPLTSDPSEAAPESSDADSMPGDGGPRRLRRETQIHDEREED